jgi:hypothetical protein
MAESDPVFKLQIVDRFGKVVTFPGGGQMERDLIASVANEVASRVSAITTRTKVQAVIAEGLKAAIYALKKETVNAL